MDYKLLCYKYINQSFNIRDVDTLSMLPLSNLLILLKNASEIMDSNYIKTFISFIQVHNEEAYKLDKLQ